MTDKPFTEEHLMNLIRNRKFKEFSTYVKEIQNINENAEESIVNVLNNLLVKKTIPNPTFMLSALMLYKTLMLGAVFDFTMEEEFFQPKIHEEVVKICEYKSSIKVSSSRGSEYFVDILKIQKTEENKDTLQKTGNSYVQLALELVQALAMWYPTQEGKPKTKTFFKRKYDELIAKKITFPKEDELLYIKKVDQENFKANYLRYKKRIEEMEEQPKNQGQKQVKTEIATSKIPTKKQEISNISKEPKSEITKPKEQKKVVPPPQAPQVQSNTLNIAPAFTSDKQSGNEMLKIVGQITSSIIPMKGTVIRSSNNKDPSMIERDDVFATNELQGSNLASPTLSYHNKGEVKPKIEGNSMNISVQKVVEQINSPNVSQKPGQSKQVSNQTKNVPAPKITESKIGPNQKANESKMVPIPKPTTKVQKFEESSDSQIDIPAPSPNQVKDPKKSIVSPLPKVQQSAIVQKNEPSKQKTSEIKPPQKEEPKKVPEVVTSNISSQKIQPPVRPETSNIQSSAQKPQVINNPASKQTTPRQSITNKLQIPNNMKSAQEMEPSFSFNNKQVPMKTPIKSNQITPRKIPKMEKANQMMSLQSSPQNTLNIPQPRQNDNNAAFFNMNPQASKRPRSMPKTQKRNSTALNFYQPNATLQYQLLAQNPNFSKQFNKTLSFWANNRPKNYPSKQLEKATSLNSLLQKMRLDCSILPFIPKYYEPITLSMQALRHESLTLFNSGASSNQFFSNGQFQCRLLKEDNNVFTLILQNVTADPMLVEYCDMRSSKYSNRIKILSWANRPDLGPYQIPRKGYMDIKFKFEVGDLNFKFLNFLLRINQRMESLVLPVTLLDMCVISTPIDQNSLQRYALKGSIISSQPFTLGERGLPSWMGGFRFSPLTNSRTRREPRQLIGECSLKLETADNEEDPENTLEILIRVVDWQERLVEINAIHITKSQFSEDLGKIMVYLLTFLMKSQ